VGELPEWSGEEDEEGWGEDEPVAVHG
jgi:hypothetical protein